MYRWLRRFLFWLPAELAHRLGMAILGWVGTVGFLRRRLRRRLPDLPELACERFGLRFPTPIGIAAGLDKEGLVVSGLFALGFGFVEVGTVTPRPQPGNPRPRLFRVPADGALINRMGFNNPGAEAVVQHLAGAYRPGPLGLNLGKNKDTPDAEATADYVRGGRAVRAVADYVVVNVSSPNTPGLRDLQRADRLLPILSGLKAEIPNRPILLKFAPDLADEDLEALCDVAVAAGAAGLIATNTTLWRPSGSVAYREAGGLSGTPLAPLARRALKLAYRRTKGSLPLIGVGGLLTAEDLLCRLQEGASLLQAYTAFIYGGPGWPLDTTLALARLLRKSGYRTVDEAIGHDASH
jgi:dihydroorotate dehydrogenase